MAEVGIDLSSTTPRKLTDDLARVREIRDEIRARVVALLEREGWRR